MYTGPRHSHRTITIIRLAIILTRNIEDNLGLGNIKSMFVIFLLLFDDRFAFDDISIVSPLRSECTEVGTTVIESMKKCRVL